MLTGPDRVPLEKREEIPPPKIEQKKAKTLLLGGTEISPKR
jgi:hypothetical protein